MKNSTDARTTIAAPSRVPNSLLHLSWGVRRLLRIKISGRPGPIEYSDLSDPATSAAAGRAIEYSKGIQKWLTRSRSTFSD